MSRAARLLDLLQVLRRHRRPVSGKALAAELGVSIRTLYRDVATLQAQGAGIEGEPGLGYVLKPGFALPPLMFDADEVDALILGLRFVIGRADPDLVGAAEYALAKVEAVLPPAFDGAVSGSGLMSASRRAGGPVHLTAIRQAIRAEVKLALGYRDKAGQPSERVVWPVAVGFFESGEMMAAWCEMRGGFRHFRLDRIASLAPTLDRLPRRHRILLAEWRLAEDLGGRA